LLWRAATISKDNESWNDKLNRNVTTHENDKLRMPKVRRAVVPGVRRGWSVVGATQSIAVRGLGPCMKMEC
jgi:hypothetical protein